MLKSYFGLVFKEREKFVQLIQTNKQAQGLAPF